MTTDNFVRVNCLLLLICIGMLLAVLAVQSRTEQRNSAVVATQHKTSFINGALTMSLLQGFKTTNGVIKEVFREQLRRMRAAGEIESEYVLADVVQAIEQP